MLDKKMEQFSQTHSGTHINVICTNLLQTIINNLFNQKTKLMSKELITLLFSWIEKWLQFHYDNMAIYNQGLHDYEMYPFFVAGIWTSFFNLFARPKMRLKFSSDQIFIFDEKNSLPDSIKSLFTENYILGIPFDQMGLTNLVHFFPANKLHPFIFATSPTTGHMECKFNDALAMDGSFIVRHLLLLLVSGICTKEVTKQGNFVHTVVKQVVSNLFPVVINLANTRPVVNSAEPSGTSSLETWLRDPLNNDAYKKTYLWLTTLYLELMLRDMVIITDSTNQTLYQIVSKYCACSQGNSITTVDAVTGVVTILPIAEQCCAFCHQSCQKWHYEPEVAGSATTFTNLHSSTTFFPNLLYPSETPFIAQLTKHCTCRVLGE
jgi:hypothetical protein